MRMNRLRIGMTLIELMVVVAIIAALAGIFAVVMVNNDSNNAYRELPREITTLFEAQRMRAMSMSVPTYVVFNMDGGNVQSIEPRLGANNGFTVCAIETPTDRRQMIPLRYDNNTEDVVAIDITTPDHQRTSEARVSDRYKTASHAYTNVKLRYKNTGVNVADSFSYNGSNPLVACFQPNGMVYFIRNKTGGYGLDLAMDEIILEIRDVDEVAPGYFEVSVNSLGVIGNGKHLEH